MYESRREYEAGVVAKATAAAAARCVVFFFLRRSGILWVSAGDGVASASWFGVCR